MKLYGIEKRYVGVRCYEYRWYSKYNGARGAWCGTKDDAIEGGKEHSEIIVYLHGENTNTESD